LLGNDDPDVAESLNDLALLLLAQGRSFEAEPLARECLAIRDKGSPGAWRRSQAQATLGASLLAQKKYPEAETLLLSGYGGLRQNEPLIPADAKPCLKDALSCLVHLYEETGMPDKAAQWKTKLR